MSPTGFSRLELRAVSSLAAVVGTRMVGLFLILPVLAIHAHELEGATPFTIGLALGIYGLTQAIFQIPFGFASDIWNRKIIIAIGLVIFGLGSLIAAYSESITGVVIGRALQGSGAIAAAVFALVGDFTRDSQRNKAMAVVGVSIGTAFTLSLMLGPVLDLWIGIQGLFLVACATALVGLLLLAFAVPPAYQANKRTAGRIRSTHVRATVFNWNLLKLNMGTFTLHAAMTALFVALPPTLVTVAGFEPVDLWLAYVPVLLISFLVMVPLIRFSARPTRTHLTMVIAALIVMLGEVVLLAGTFTSYLLLLGLLLYFIGFNVLEALLPSVTIKIASHEARGTALGVFNTYTFIGAFTGGAVGGFLFGYFGAPGVFSFCAILIFLWTIFIIRLRPLEPRFV